MVPVLIQKFFCKSAGCVAVDLLTSWWVMKIELDGSVLKGFVFLG